MNEYEIGPQQPNPKDIAVLGIPFDQNSSFLHGTANAPGRIREAFFSESANLWTENGIDLGEITSYQMVGDLNLDDPEDVFDQIESEIDSLLRQQVRVISLGGDHSITYPILRAYSRHFPGLSILQLDAHPDLYDEMDGNRFSHASPFARIMEEKQVARLVQVGIRTMTGHQRRQVDRFGVEVIEMRDIDKFNMIAFDGSVYLSLDMDCLDPAFAPGVSHYEPGGMSTRQVLELLQGLKGQLVGADIVEYNPIRDPQQITAMVAAKLLKEVIGKMMEKKI
jgi:agmatinase